jgi:hypothetical protein
MSFTQGRGDRGASFSLPPWTSAYGPADSELPASTMNRAPQPLDPKPSISRNDVGPLKYTTRAGRRTLT